MAELKCLNCQKAVCPIDPVKPPCQEFDPYAIAAVVNRKLQAITTDNVSSVITAYRPPAARLNRCINSVLPYVSEVVVTFNADGVIPDGVLKHPKVRYLKTRLPNIGYGRNANFGARHTSGKYILFLNDDAYLQSGGVETLVETIQSQPNVGIVGHLIRYPNGIIQHGGTRRNPGDLGWGHIDHTKLTPSIDKVTEMDNVNQASCLMLREAFYKAMGYDEQYFMYYEDNALSLAVRKAGYKILYTPFVSAIHDEHATSDTYQKPEMAERVRAARRTFERDWGKYFKHNNNVDGVTKIGTFNYEH